MPFMSLPMGQEAWCGVYAGFPFKGSGWFSVQSMYVESLRFVVFVWERRSKPSWKSFI